MVYSVEPHARESLNLAELIDHIEATVDFRSEDSIMGAADALAALANNPTFLCDWLNEQLTEDLYFPSDGYVAGVTTLAATEDYLVRANVWLPPKPGSLDKAADDRAASYLLPHDHNFTFLTVGYFGSGYRTEIYEYEPERIAGYPGEPVSLTFLEDTTLPRGKVMLYRESRDIHIQHHSEEFSISLNILSMHRRYDFRQRMFDLEAGCVDWIVPDPIASRTTFLCRMAGLIGNDETDSFLASEIENNSLDPQSRWHAIESRVRLNPDLAQSLYEAAAANDSELVSSLAKRKLGGVPALAPA